MNYQACMDIVLAMGTYKEYVATMEEMMDVQEKEEEEMVNKWEQLNKVAMEMFKTENLTEEGT